MKTSKSTVLFDGSNFYYKLKELSIPHTSMFDYAGLSQILSKKSYITEQYYCIGKIRAKQHDKKARVMMAKQQALATRLQKDGFTIQFGYLLKSDHLYHEKGVDVQLAVNMVKDARENRFDIAYLASSDSDLIPAIIEAQRIGKTICYVGFKHKISYSLLKTCKKSRLLTRDDLLPFISK
jgi:uncharacterized LabA/DUF88 family protein